MCVDLKAWNDNLTILQNVEEIINEIRKNVDVGMCGSPQPEYLFCLSHSLKNLGEIVEIGTCAGHSLVALAYGQKLKSGKKVTTIDIKKHSSLEQHIDKAQIKDWVNIKLGNSKDIAKNWKKPIELLWIDGDHRYRGVKEDIVNWEKFVIKDGLIVLHDYRNGTGVWQAVHETLLAKPWIWKVASDRQYGSIFVVEKIAVDEVSSPPWFDKLSSPKRPSRWLNKVICRFWDRKQKVK